MTLETCHKRLCQPTTLFVVRTYIQAYILVRRLSQKGKELSLSLIHTSTCLKKQLYANLIVWHRSSSSPSWFSTNRARCSNFSTVLCSALHIYITWQAGKEVPHRRTVTLHHPTIPHPENSKDTWEFPCALSASWQSSSHSYPGQSF